MSPCWQTLLAARLRSDQCAEADGREQWKRGGYTMGFAGSMASL